MIRDAVTCDQDGCLGLMLEPLACEVGVDPCDGCEYCEEPLEGHMAWRGWVRDENGHVCPACNHGRGPVLERGECPTCMGRTVDRPEGAACLYCRTVMHPADDLG